MNKSIQILILIIVLSSCTEINQEMISAEVQRQFEERKNSLLTERLSQCTRQMYKDAQSLADSILRIESKQSKMDSIKVPYDTLRPIKPDINFPDYKKPTRDSIIGRKN